MSDLAKAFAGIKEAQQPATPQLVSVQTPKRLSVAPAKRQSGEAAKLPLQNTGKSKHPEFEKVTIYVRKQTRKAAWRKWEDAQGGDFSDLVERLLSGYLDT